MDDLTKELAEATISLVSEMGKMVYEVCNLVTLRYSANKKIRGMSEDIKSQWNSLRTVNEVLLVNTELMDIVEKAIRLENLLIRNRCGDKKIKETWIKLLENHVALQEKADFFLNNKIFEEYLLVDVSGVKPKVL